MPVRVTGHTVNVHDDVLVRISMAADTFLCSGVLDVTVGAVQLRMFGWICDELLLSVFVAQHALLAGHDRTELDHCRSMWVMTDLTVCQSGSVFNPVTIQACHGFGMILVTGIASVSNQWRIITVGRRTQCVSVSLIAGVLRRMSATGCDELGILGLMAISTAIAGVCGMGRMTIPAVAFH